jgi:hypothetical protein
MIFWEGSHGLCERLGRHPVVRESEETVAFKVSELKQGIPPHDVYQREIIAIDGNTHRGSFNGKEGTKAIHLVSAWATRNRLVFGQVKTEESNRRFASTEITAIPTLLEKIALEGCIVTIDASETKFLRGASTRSPSR